jgi:hypothetical protein
MIAATIRNNPNDRQAIADGFDLIAESLEQVQALVEQAISEMHDGRPCEDCGAPLPSIGDLPSPVINPRDLPDAGADTDSTVTQGA